MTIINKIYDDVNVGLIPGDAAAVAGYVDGNFQTYPSLLKRFGGKVPVISITVFGNHARIVDIEPGNPLNNSQAANWTHSMVLDGVYLPGPYSSVSNIDSLAADLSSTGLKRNQYVIWSAHYTGTPHICGPSSCGACRTQCDATQYTNRASGESLDETLAQDYFLSPHHGPPPPPPPTKEVTVNVTVPVVQNGSNDASLTGRPVVRVQALVNALDGAGIAEDGVFGPGTTGAVEDFQRGRGLSVDGVVGPDTWKALYQP